MQNANCLVQDVISTTATSRCPFRRVLWLLPLAVCNTTGPALAQQPPPETIKIVVGTSNKDHKRVLSDKGHALEVPLNFPMIERESVAIEAKLEEAGRFDIELVSRAAVEVKDVRVEDGVGRAEIVRKTQPMSPDDLIRERDKRLEQLAGKQAIDKARSAAEKTKAPEMRRYLLALGLGDPGEDDTDGLRATYALAKAFEGKADALRKKLNEAAEANPRRFTTQDKKAWDAMKAGDLYVYYRKVLQTEIAEEHLARCGLDFDRSTRNAAEKVIPTFLALYGMMSGETLSNPEQARAAKEAMTGGTGAVIREALNVDLRLRIYSETDSDDPNAQWFNAQRVACRATGVRTIRVEGTLDPEKNDAVDWWILEKWDPATVEFSTSNEGGVRFDAPQVTDGVARLRVAADKKAVRYWFQMRVERGSLDVVIHESFIPAQTKFPY